MISLAGGFPWTAAFPPSLLVELTERVAREGCAEALQYGPTEGLADLRAILADRMRTSGTPTEPDDLLITSRRPAGARSARARAARSRRSRDLRGADLPRGGSRPDGGTGRRRSTCRSTATASSRPALAEALERCEHEGRPAKLIYVIPTFQNPSGASLSLERRAAVLELAVRHDVLVIEDNPYAAIRFEGEPLPTPAGPGTAPAGSSTSDALEDPLAGPAGGLGGRRPRGARQDEPGQAGGRPVHARRSRSGSQRCSWRPLDRAARGPARRSTRAPRRPLRAPRPRNCRPGSAGAARGRPLRLGDAAARRSTPTTCSALASRARSRSSRPRRLPRRARALARCASTSRRVDGDTMREGVRRIGGSVDEKQLELAGALAATRSRTRAGREGRRADGGWSLER